MQEQNYQEPSSSQTDIIICPYCGGKISISSQNNYACQNSTSKNRITYILLAVFFGMFGVHNFYAGHTSRAVAQLCITIFSVFVLSFVSQIWSLFEIIYVKVDGQGIPFYIK